VVPEMMSLQLSSEQSVGDVWIAQLDWKRVPQARSRGCKSSAAVAADVLSNCQIQAQNFNRVACMTVIDHSFASVDCKVSSEILLPWIRSKTEVKLGLKL